MRPRIIHWKTRIALCGLLACVAAAAKAQSGTELIAQGVRAYQELEMEAASLLFRRALERESLPRAERSRALAFLGASELYRDRRDSVSAAFRRLVLSDPRYRLDPLVFSPEVSAAFDEVRHATPVTEVAAPSRALFSPGRGGLVVRIYASTPHTVRVRVENAQGQTVRTLHADAVADSLRVVWNGQGRRSARLDAGLYRLSVASLGAAGGVRRSVELPLSLAHTRQDSLPHPAPPALRPERASAGPAFVRLGLGLGGALALAVVVPGDEKVRYSAAAVLAAAGVIGFMERRPGKPYPDNVVANAATRAAWEARVQDVAEQNRRLRPGARLLIETGRPVLRESLGG